MMLNYIIREVGRLAPGQAIEISRLTLAEIGCVRIPAVFGPVWSPVDQIMNRIVGSSYEWLPRKNPEYPNGSVTFYRLKKPLEDEMTWMCPDRRDRAKALGWKQTPCGIWCRDGSNL